MQTLTSRDVQNRYGDFIESMQDDVVCVTRHGRPLFWAISDRDVRGDTAILIGRALLLHGQARAFAGDKAGDDLGALLDSFGDAALTAGLTEDDVMQIVHDNRI
jgi:prevent-host-death family protein